MKNYILSGGGSGIGQRMAQKLLQRGERVCAVDVNGDALAELKKYANSEDQLHLEQLDVRDIDQWEALFKNMEERWGKIDVLMNIAGIYRTGPVNELTKDLINNVIDTNLKGVILGTSVASRYMIPKRNGHIINISSTAGLCSPYHYSIYSASKFGVRGFSIAAAQDLDEYGINVTVIYPTIVKTPMVLNDEQLSHEDVSFSYAVSVIEVDEVVDVIDLR